MRKLNYGIQAWGRYEMGKSQGEGGEERRRRYVFVTAMPPLIYTISINWYILQASMHQGMYICTITYC
jgi:hypothetical protein